MKKIYSTFILFIICISLYAQNYCIPAFAFGCSSWNTQSVNLDAIQFTIGSNCQDWDFTTDTAYLNAGSSYPMSVSNGAWCGCGVWIDFNNDFTFDTTENVFHQYIANANNTYSFTISIPSAVSSGTYRMRVISGWGTDCYSSTSMNGFGPCGSYQYGNYIDFSVNISNTTSIETNTAAPALFNIFPNPGTDYIILPSNSIQHVDIYDSHGNIVTPYLLNASKLDLSTLKPGVYIIRLIENNNSYQRTFIKL